MASPTEDALPPEAQTRVFHRLRAVLIALVIAVGGASAGAAWHQAEQAADRDDAAVARRAVDLVMSTASSTEAALAGAGGLVRSDGLVDVDAFVVFGEGVASSSSLSALAYEPVVPSRVRGAFERELGRPISDRVEGGGFAPAPDRAEHFPVRVIAPETDTTRPMLGFDLAGDPVRRAAAELARDSGRLVFTEPVPSQPSGTTSFFIIKPLYRRDLPLDTVTQRRVASAGFISSASVGSGLDEALARALPRGTRFAVSDHGAALAGSKQPPTHAVTRTVAAANRTWTLDVDGPARSKHGVALLLAGVAALLAGGLALVFRSSNRHEREIRRSASLIARTADLAQGLSRADTVGQVGQVIQDQLRVVLGTPVAAAATSVGMIEGDVLRVMHGPDVPEDYRRRFTSPPLTSDLAITEAARTGETLLFETQEAYDERYPSAGGPKAGARAILPLRRANGTTIGAMAHLWPMPVEFDNALVSTLNTIAQLTGQALERARLAQVREEDARHTQGLARLAQGLTSRTNSEAVMTFLTQGVLAPLDAYHAAVGVVDGSTLVRHFTPGDIADAVARSGPTATPLETDAPLTQAVRLGEPIYLADEEQFRSRYPHLADGWLSVGYGATANLPLRDRKGAVIGALGVAWDHPVVFDPDLVDRLSTVAGIAGQTLERTQLVDRLRAEARGSEALAELAEVLATARSADEVVSAAAAQAAQVAGADRVELAIVDPVTDQVHLDGRTLGRSAAGSSPDAESAAFLDVVRDGGTLTFSDRAVTALRDTSGRRVGAIGFVWNEPVELDSSRLVTLRNVADLCSQALERAQLSDAEHRLVTTLQDSVLAPLPPGEGLVCAARYLPAARSVGMGGDWYEAIVLEDDRYVVVVGDVAGHGITAVGQMAQFRSVIGALIRLGTPLEELFTLATSVVQGIDPIASAVVAEIDLRAGRVRYAAAGHLPPLLRMPDGTVVVLEGGRQSLLGVDMPSNAVGEHPFPPGATLLCYTDGLIERRGEAIDESVNRLALVLAERSLPRPGQAVDPHTLADELLRVCLTDRAPTDDVAVALITRWLDTGTREPEAGQSGFRRSAGG